MAPRLTVRPKITPTAVGPGGLPTYTRAQLHAVKPKANYLDYINYISKRRQAVPGPAWPGRGGPGLPNIESMIRQVQIESPAQLQARQNQIVASNVAAQKGLLTSGYTNEAALAQQAHKQALGEALRTMQAQSAAGRAASALNTDLFGMVGGQYNLGAQELAGLATGGVSDVTDQTAANTAATNQALASVGMPGIDSRLAGPEQASVARFRAGLGAQNLVNQGEAANFGLAGQINAQNLRATQEAIAGQNQTDRTAGTDLTNALAQAARTRSAGLQQIALQRPELAAKTLQQLQDANRQQIALGSTLLQQRRAALQAGFQQRMTQKTFAQNVKQSLAQNKLTKQRIDAAQNLAIKKATASATAASNKAAMPNSALSKTTGMLVDANGKMIPDANGNPIVLPGFKFDPKTGQIVKTYKPDAGAGAAGGGPSASAISTYLKSLTGKPQYASTTKTTGQPGDKTSTRTETETGKTYPVTFGQALKRLTTWGKLDDKTARNYLQSVYPRGQGGRAWLTNEEQDALKLYAARVPTRAGPRAQGAKPGGEPTGPEVSARDILAVHTNKGWRYLSPEQHQILQSAGLLPPGGWGHVPGKPHLPAWYIAK